jgi:HPt (histidine-containing phosphotransfer) domain-containing protein
MSAAWEDTPRFDISALVQNFGDDSEVLESILHIFLEEAPQRVAAIRHGVREGDHDAVKKAAHSLANTTGTLEAERALLLARATEEAARSADHALVTERAALLLDEVERILSQIRGYRGSEPDS